MKIAVMFDSASENVNYLYFDSMMYDFVDKGYDIRILCRGIKSRTGDRYDILRGRKDVYWSEGMPPLISIASEEGWSPDLVINSPANLMDTEFFGTVLKED